MKTLLQYVQPKGPLPDLLGAKQGRKLVVIGSAGCVWNDLDKIDLQDFDRMVINDMMLYAPFRVDFGVTVHPEKLKDWQKIVRQMETMSIRPCGHLVNHVWPLHRDGGTSGLFGVFLGLLMGYGQIVLAGIPCDDSPRFFDDPEQKHPQMGRPSVHAEWLRAREAIFGNKVKSLSGNTREWLGEP